MSEIDFKTNKRKTREMLKARIEKRKKQDKIYNLITAGAIILMFIIFCMYSSKMTEREIKNCIDNGNSKEYCEQVLG